MQPKDAAEIHDMFFRASASERVLILHNLAETPLRAAARIPLARAACAVEALEMAAFNADVENFTIELGETLILPARVAAQVVNDPGGEPLACSARAINMPSPVFQRVLLFLNPAIGCSVQHVYRLSRLYDRLSERSALVMLAAWRGSTMAVTRAKFRPALYDDERLCGAARLWPYHAHGHAGFVTRNARGSRARQIQEMAALAILGLDDPNVGIEADFLLEPLFHRLLRHRLRRCRDKNALHRSAFVIGALRRRHIQHRLAVEQGDLNENCPRLFGAAPAHRTEHACPLAAA
jgi:hypothetical protein